MSQENVEIAKRMFGAFARGDADWVEGFAEDMTWDISAHPLPDWPTTGSGRDEFLGHLAAYLASWTDYRSEPREFLDAGDAVVVVLHETIRIPGSGETLERDLIQVWTVEDGKGSHLRVFPDRAEAREAVGLPE